MHANGCREGVSWVLDPNFEFLISSPYEYNLSFRTKDDIQLLHIASKMAV